MYAVNLGNCNSSVCGWLEGFYVSLCLHHSTDSSEAKHNLVSLYSMNYVYLVILLSILLSSYTLEAHGETKAETFSSILCWCHNRMFLLLHSLLGKQTTTVVPLCFVMLKSSKWDEHHKGTIVFSHLCTGNLVHYYIIMLRFSNFSIH